MAENPEKWTGQLGDSLIISDLVLHNLLFMQDMRPWQLRRWGLTDNEREEWTKSLARGQVPKGYKTLPEFEEAVKKQLNQELYLELLEKLLP
ncbi:MAG: hypothetical protein AAB656_03995 [Patescibacteria group bacterium]